MRSRKPKIATALTVIVTASLTGLNFRYPFILEALQRAPAPLSSHEWWRLFSPILIERGSWMEIALNLIFLIWAGAIAEGRMGAGRWLLFYIVGGFAGECAGIFWKPLGAGSSVAVCGLLGGLAGWLLLRGKTWQAGLGGLALILAGILLTIVSNLHGPPILVCAGVAGFIFWTPPAPVQPS